ncbi:MAG: ABC transporter ATP-binding protein [Candidatus Thalassarchaeaceae archaeon]|jgi:sodium transport system ATP-binding protein|nr:ABC transporter ATP-binding protein [Candidatus Thalassarchaeaceae archaeon]MDP7042641.1 ABC transporter ATP-binding protein [Candidatus Thalassarchaeaceae archaeon]
MDMTGTLLSVRDVSKNFGDVEALKSITLDLNRGDVVGLVGGNGAGKTTLLRLLCGLYKPSIGGVVFIDEGGDEHPVHQVRSNLGVVPESTGLYARLTAWENIRYHSRLNNIPDKQAWNRTIRLARALEIEDEMQRPTRGFSRGMRQKTALIRALAHDPEVLLLDEPTGGLDVTSARRVRELVRKLGEEGRTVIYSTHQLNEAEQVCDRIVIIHNGTLRADGSPNELMNNTNTKSLEDAFVSLTQDDSREVDAPEPESKFQQLWSKLTTRKQPPTGGEDNA